MAAAETATVAIVTWRRPDHVRRSLEHLAAQTRPPDQVIVVDASEDEATQEVVAAFPGVEYYRFPRGRSRTTRSRNEALRHANGDVIAWLDDDSYPVPTWLEELLRAFREHPEAVGLAGRTRNGIPGEEIADPDDVGRLRDDGVLSSYFAADLPGPIPIDHGPGGNMAFRRAALVELNGFREDIIGPSGICEETDMFLRLRLRGARFLYVPTAAVDHQSAPHAHGRRFDWRQTHHGYRNHVLMLARNEGLSARRLWRYVRWAVKQTVNTPSGSTARRMARIFFGLTGIARGLGVAVVKARPAPVDPRR